MTKNLFILFLLLYCAHARAQTSNSASTQESHRPSAIPAQKTFSHWLVGLSFGAAIPVANFSAKDVTNAQAGYAITGFVAELSGTYLFVPAFGVVLAAARQDNAIGVPKDLQGLSTGTPGGAITIHNHHWNITRIQTGAVFNQSLWSGGPSLQIRALAGVLKTAMPGYHYSFAVGGPNQGSGGTAADEPLLWAFSYQADAGLKWPLSRQLMLLFNAGYTGSKPVLDQKIYITGTSPGGGAYETKKTYATGTIYAQAGIGIGF